MLLFPYKSKTRGERPKWISDSDSTSKNKTNLTKPNLFITSKLLLFHAYLIHYFLTQKIWTSDNNWLQIQILHRKINRIKEKKHLFYMTLNDNNTLAFHRQHTGCSTLKTEGTLKKTRIFMQKTNMK